MPLPARPAALLLGLLLASPAPAAEPAGQEYPVVKGAVVSLDLSGIPRRLELRGAAACAGRRRLATGELEPVPCQRPFTFEAPAEGAPLVLRFRPKAGGAPARVEFPYARDPRPRTFTAPADGTVSLEQPSAPEKPRQLPAPLQAEARAAAAAACGGCPGQGPFELTTFTVEPSQPAVAPIGLTIRAP